MRNSGTDIGAEVLRRFGPDPHPVDPDDCFWDYACEGMLESEAKWRQRGEVFAWIDEKPAWVSAADWGLYILEDPKQSSTRRFRLELIGGGQIRVTETFVPWSTLLPKDRDDRSMTRKPMSPPLQVQAHVDGVLATYRGRLSVGASYEMAAYAVVFPSRVPQVIADRTATSLRLIDAGSPNGRDNFFALLARGTRCGCCGRPLKDEISKLLGVGPDCARSMRLPHNLEFANRILKRRRELLGVPKHQRHPHD
jgi:hypothetical protein